MPESYRCDRVPHKAGGTDSLRSFVVFAGLVLMLLVGCRYVAAPIRSEIVAAVPVRSQALQTKAIRAQGLGVGSPFLAAADPFGWLAFIAKPLYLALRFLYGHGVGNWGWAIILLTVMFNLLTAWPRVLSTKSSLKMMRLQPRVDAIKQRYAHLSMKDPKRTEMNMEMMALYKAEGASMFGGCLPTLLQMPLLLGYMRVLRSAPELHQAHWYWLRDLSMPDPLHILPLLIIASMILTQCITPTPGMPSSQRWMMATMMPVVMGISLWHYASGLSLYWITGNLISLVIQLAINRSAIGKEVRGLAAARSATRS